MISFEIIDVIVLSSLDWISVLNLAVHAREFSIMLVGSRVSLLGLFPTRWNDLLNLLPGLAQQRWLLATQATKLVVCLRLVATRASNSIERLLLLTQVRRTLTSLLWVSILSLSAGLLRTSSPVLRSNVTVSTSPTRTLWERLPTRPPLPRVLLRLKALRHPRQYLLLYDGHSGVITCLTPPIRYRLRTQSKLNIMLSRLPMGLLPVTPLRLSMRTELVLWRTTPRTSPTRADPLVLPGLTSFTTQFPGRLKAMLLSAKLELQRPAMLAIRNVTVLDLDTMATVTASLRGHLPWHLLLSTWFNVLSGTLVVPVF